MSTPGEKSPLIHIIHHTQNDVNMYPLLAYQFVKKNNEKIYIHVVGFQAQRRRIFTPKATIVQLLYKLAFFHTCLAIYKSSWLILTIAINHPLYSFSMNSLTKIRAFSLNNVFSSRGVLPTTCDIIVVTVPSSHLPCLTFTAFYF